MKEPSGVHSEFHPPDGECRDTRGERRQSDDTGGLEPVERDPTIKWTGIDSDTSDLIVIVMESTVSSF